MAKFAAKKKETAEGPITVDVKRGKFATKAEKPAKVVKAAKEVANDEEGGKRGRKSQYAGKKIKLLVKEHGARVGSIRAALMDAIMDAKAVDDVIGTTVKAGDKTGVVSSADVAFAVEANLISVS